MAKPCSFALAAAKVPGKRWRTRAELLGVLELARVSILEGEACDLAALALSIGVSQFHLQRLFTAAYGESPRVMSARVRAEQAGALLAQGLKPIEVLAILRYSELSAFSRAFRRHFGVSPREFCKNCQPPHQLPKTD
jgi:AraC-like DNA-binding protein